MSGKLFVIGTGFDKSHGLDTLYEDFHQYLRLEYPEADEDTYIVPDFVLDHHGNEVFDTVEVVSYLLTLISRTEGECWSQFENTLGQLDFSQDFDNLPECFDRDGDRNLFHEAYNNENLAEQLWKCVPKIKELFNDWIRSIDISKAEIKKDFKELIDIRNDIFLSFNYTMTLEKIYHIENVCHIHGRIGEELIFGHGEESFTDEGNRVVRYVGSEDGLDKIHSALHKDTYAALEKHMPFFNSLTEEIYQIYVYGFSCGKVDELYLKEIIKRTAKENATWYFLKREDKSEKEKVLRELGFKGAVKDYDIRGTE